MSSDPSLWVLYQPLMVGFGAVVLGFLASIGLEFWKDKIRRQHERDKLRNALIFEFRIFRQAIEMERLNAVERKGLVDLSIYLPVLIEQIDRLEVGRLHYEEVCALADFVRTMDRMRSIVSNEPAVDMEGRYLSMKFNAKDVETRQMVVGEFVQKSDEVLRELERAIKRRRDWRSSLPPHARAASMSADSL